MLSTFPINEVDLWHLIYLLCVFLRSYRNFSKSYFSANQYHSWVPGKYERERVPKTKREGEKSETSCVLYKTQQTDRPIYICPSIFCVYLLYVWVKTDFRQHFFTNKEICCLFRVFKTEPEKFISALTYQNCLARFAYVLSWSSRAFAIYISYIFCSTIMKTDIFSSRKYIYEVPGALFFSQRIFISHIILQ